MQAADGAVLAARRARMLHDSGLLDAGEDPGLTRLTDLATRLLKAPVSLVSLVHEQGQRFPGQTGLAQPWAAQGGTPLSHSFCQHVVASGEPLVVADARTEPLVADNLAIRDLGVVAYAGYPVRADDGTVLGSFCVISDEPRTWSGDELHVVADLAEAAGAEVRLRLLAAAERRAHERVTLLSDVTLALHASLDLERSLQSLADAVVPALADCCVVDLRGPARRRRHTVITHRDPATAELLRRTELGHPRANAPRTALEEVLAGAPGVLVPVVTDERLRLVAADEGQYSAWRAASPSSVIVVPVTARGEVLGALTLVRQHGSPAYDQADLDLAVELGRRAGVAVDNDQLYAAERQRSMALQLGLLPALPQLPGIRVSARYLPAQRGAQVGGDWYDLLDLPSGAVGVVIGDVVGHDSAAAATMGQLRAVLRSYAWDRADPADVLDRTCRLVRGMGGGQFATVFYGLLSAPRPDGARTLHHATAGHPPPVLLLPDGRTELLDGPSGGLVGVHTGPRTAAGTDVPAGSTLLCYTDGLVEHRDRDITTGTAELREVLSAQRGREPGDLVDAVLAAMVDGTRRRDDVAVIALAV
ncbi:hypothetical protein NUM3379_01600 [Kineococcus sp. NUM-3379]